MNEMDETEMPASTEQPVTAAPVPPEPALPAHLRLEAGHMSELMDHIKAWFAWAKNQA